MLRSTIYEIEASSPDVEMVLDQPWIASEDGLRGLRSTVKSRVEADNYPAAV